MPRYRTLDLELVRCGVSRWWLTTGIPLTYVEPMDTTTGNPFDLDLYWSQSQGQFIAVRDMPLPYARNVYAKLLREHGNEFVGTTLAVALAARLIPTRDDTRSTLLGKGHVSVYAPGRAEASRIRALLRRIGAKEGVKVTTRTNGDFVEGSCTPVQAMSVNIRKVVR